MDSADSSQIKSVLAQQGVLLGQHKTQPDSLSRTLKTFAGSMNHLTAQFQQFQLGREATLSNPVPAPQVSGKRLMRGHPLQRGGHHIQSILVICSNPIGTRTSA
ncbi:hypothetical protein SKAU_G00133710 [Synaphobranchus kaupii]|uniref:Uncharacterized protein n=1 Tax=Synaphobranchus kaupii TaxID=118154 RepID=A0A9Q1FQW8_SYNKA|nr:hypothetical protein SKAU_G00133710 [Synaphobranchus kaupii]